MKRRPFLPALMLLALACGGEDAVLEPPPTRVADLTVRSDVLYFIEWSHNGRNMVRFESALDDSFRFLPSPGDVRGGLPAEWDRDTELQLVNRLFDPDLNEPGLDRCTGLMMDVYLEEGVDWEEVPASGGETWYAATLYCNGTVWTQRMGCHDVGSKQRLTVRNAGTDEAPRWQLVEWQEFDRFTAAPLRGSAVCWTVSWGYMKAMYADPP